MQNEYRKAEELYKKSLGIEEKILPKNQLSIARTYNHLACTYYKQNEYQIALVYYFKAYNIFINRHGFEHHDTKICLQNIEIVYAEWNPEGNFEHWLEEQMKETE